MPLPAGSNGIRTARNVEDDQGRQPNQAAITEATLTPFQKVLADSTRRRELTTKREEALQLRQSSKVGRELVPRARESFLTVHPQKPRVLLFTADYFVLPFQLFIWHHCLHRSVETWRTNRRVAQLGFCIFGPNVGALRREGCSSVPFLQTVLLVSKPTHDPCPLLCEYSQFHQVPEGA